MILTHSTSPEKIALRDVPKRFDPIIKSLGGSRAGVFPEPPYWELPRLLSTVRQIRRRFPNVEIDDRLEEDLARPPVGEVVHPRFYEYQNRGAHFLASRSGLLSFDPGLGKTATAIAAADLLDANRILIVAPLTLLPMWQREIEAWTVRDREISIVRDYVVPKKTRLWAITNYDHLARKPEAFDRPWDVMILDESILVKNRDTQRFKSVKWVRQKSKLLWELSGYPSSRDASDLWSQFHLLYPQRFRSFWRFVHEYCIVEQTPWGAVIAGSAPNIDFSSEFTDILHRVAKRDVLDLPDMLFEKVECTMTPKQQRAYQQAMDDFVVDLTEGSITMTTRLAQLTRLSQILGNLGNLDPTYDESGKLDALIDLAQSEHFGTPAIVWTKFIGSAERIAYRLAREGFSTGLITGSTPNPDRDSLLRQFREHELEFLVMSTAVGKYGLTLTEAETMIYFEKGYNLDDYVQSLDRVHRIGLDHHPLVITLSIPGTVDDLVADNLEAKSVDLSKLTNAELANLLGGLGR